MTDPTGRTIRLIKAQALRDAAQLLEDDYWQHWRYDKGVTFHDDEADMKGMTPPEWLRFIAKTTEEEEA